MAASSRILLNHLFRGPSRPNKRLFHLTPTTCMAAHDAEFDQAKSRLNTLKEDPGNDVKLKLYALFKQASIGACNVPKPGMMDFVGKAKWQAWNDLGSITQDEAQKKYIDVVNGLVGEEEATAQSQTETDGKYKEIKVTRDEGLFLITLNRPTKKNAINYQMYAEIPEALSEASKDKSVAIVAVTGAGDFYCSGNDLSNFANIPPEGLAKMAHEGKEILIKFIASFIDFDKPLIGLINGPAVGVSVTILGLFDAVYASDKATFHTPFTALGQSPEGCSSYLFPKIMGPAKASEMLLFNKKITAHEAEDRNLVTEVLPHDTFEKEIMSRVSEYAKLPKKSLQASKNVIRDTEKQKLHDVNIKESNELADRWQSDECMNAIMNFFQQKSNL